jgi:FKBP-type peptidyl-prolyl cis-trans isomerase (trigger factor)
VIRNQQNQSLHSSPFSGNLRRMNTTAITTKITKLPNSRVEILVTIPSSEIETFRTKALNNFKQNLEIDGFRKGHAPEAKIIERVGDIGILTEMADLALTESYPSILEQSGVEPISRPEITITKLVPNNDVEYTITSDVLPTVEIKNIEKIAKEKNKDILSVEITDQDVEHAIKEIRQMRAHQQMHDDGVDHHDHNHQNIPDEQLPELTDDYVKSLGEFENVEDFKKKLKENMEKEKIAHAHEKRRIEIIEAIIEQGTYDIPASMVDFELNKMMEQFKYDLAMNGMGIDEYARHIGKSIDDMKHEWRERAEKRVRMQLTLEKIADEFSIKPDQTKIDEEVAKVMDMYQNESLQKENVIAYVTQIMINTAVFDWLEMQK